MEITGPVYLRRNICQNVVNRKLLTESWYHKNFRIVNFKKFYAREPITRSVVE